MASVDGVALSSRSALAYSPGQNLCWWVQSWEQEVTTVSFTSGDCIYYGLRASTRWVTPVCQGLGSCGTPTYGVIGNNTWTVNPWYNQYVYYFALTLFFYCRHYVSANASISAYCG